MFCEAFNIKQNSIVYTKRNQNDDFKMNSINFAITKYKIKDYKNEILNVLHIFNLSSESFEEWFKLNQQNYIYWIAINKVLDEHNVTFYYRKS